MAKQQPKPPADQQPAPPAAEQQPTQPAPPAEKQPTPPAEPQPTPPAEPQPEEQPKQPEEQPEATIGRIVHYRVKDGQFPGKLRAAIITNVKSRNVVNLTVFADAQNLSLYEERDAADVPFDDEGTGKPGTWSWPPRN